MPDYVVMIGLSLLTFVMGIAWCLAVSAKFFLRNRRTILILWGGFCAAMMVVFVTISLLHLGHQLFGWMTPDSQTFDQSTR